MNRILFKKLGYSLNELKGNAARFGCQLKPLILRISS